MRKLLKNSKGFTLIELMMVIAVIGILAAVLIPKIGGTKDNAKLSGVDANARIVQANVNGIIGRYQHQSASCISSFATALQNTLTDVTNPFTNVEGAAVDSTATTAAIIDTVAVTISDQSGVAQTADASNAADDQRGCILVIPTEASNSITSVLIVPYDNFGNAMPTITVTN